MHRTGKVTLAGVMALAIAHSATAADGKIVVTHDDHLLADQGFNLSSGTEQFVANITNWFTPDTTGNFLAYSNNFGLTGPMLAQTMANLGHTWTVDRNVQFDVPTLLQYDAVWVCGDAADTTVLTDYVRAGGHVYVGGGTGRSGSSAATWNPFLNNFDLALSDVDNGINATIDIDINHPLFHGVTDLYQNNGADVLDLSAGDCSQAIVWSDSGNSLTGMSDTTGNLELYAYSSSYSAGDTLQFTGGLANAGDAAVLAIVDVSGFSLFLTIFEETFGSDCRWSREFPIPPGIPTADVTMVLYTWAGKVISSNPVVIPFP